VENALLTIVLIVVLVSIFSQFGGKLNASSAWSWWLVGLFLVVASYQPEVFRPIADAFGVKFISNFVLAALVTFLFMQGLSAQATTVQLARNMRQFVSKEAVSRYLDGNASINQTTRTLVILPTYNEQGTVGQIAHELSCLTRVDPSLSFCFINDGSCDKTKDALDRINRSHSMEHLTNINVSGVLRSGFSLAEALGVQYVVQCDADGQHPISEIPRLVKEAEDSGVDCLVGSRFVNHGFVGRISDGSTSVFRAIGSQSLCWVIRVFFGVKISDPTSGFRVYSRAAVKILTENLPDEYPEPESIAILATHGLKIAEIPVTMQARASGVSSLNGFKSLAYMAKVISALVGLRIRTLLR
jgi:hypothetical protein